MESEWHRVITAALRASQGPSERNLGQGVEPMLKWERELRDMQRLLKKQDVLIDDVRSTLNHYQKALSETDAQMKLWRKRAEKLQREVEFYKKQAEHHPGRYAKKRPLR